MNKKSRNDINDLINQMLDGNKAQPQKKKLTKKENVSTTRKKTVSNKSIKYNTLVESIFSGVDKILEKSMRKSIFNSICENANISSNDKVRKLKELENVKLTKEHASKFIKKYIDPVLECSLIEHYNGKDPIVVSNAIYEASLAIQLAKDGRFKDLLELHRLYGSFKKSNKTKTSKSLKEFLDLELNDIADEYTDNDNDDDDMEDIDDMSEEGDIDIEKPIEDLEVDDDEVEMEMDVEDDIIDDTADADDMDMDMSDTDDEDIDDVLDTEGYSKKYKSEEAEEEDYDDEQGEVPGEQDTGPDEYEERVKFTESNKRRILKGTISSIMERNGVKDRRYANQIVTSAHNYVKEGKVDHLIPDLLELYTRTSLPSTIKFANIDNNVYANKLEQMILYTSGNIKKEVSTGDISDILLSTVSSAIIVRYENAVKNNKTATLKNKLAYIKTGIDRANKLVEAHKAHTNSLGTIDKKKTRDSITEVSNYWKSILKKFKK